jgi:hypothetical protein
VRSKFTRLANKNSKQDKKRVSKYDAFRFELASGIAVVADSAGVKIRDGGVACEWVGFLTRETRIIYGRKYGRARHLALFLP